MQVVLTITAIVALPTGLQVAYSVSTPEANNDFQYISTSWPTSIGDLLAGGLRANAFTQMNNFITNYCPGCSPIATGDPVLVWAPEFTASTFG